MPPIIEVDHVTKEFILGKPPSLKETLLNGFNRLLGKPVDGRQPFKALNDVNFSVEPGEVLGIIGHNGAGKSTLLKVLARIGEPTSGKVVVRGRVAPLIEVGAGLVGDMTGRENIFLNAAILGMKKAEIRRRFDQIVAFSELEEFIDTPVKRYSSGMKVKLGFSIATSVDAEILIVDEVMAVGDVAFQRKSIERMQQLIRGEGRTVLIVGHNIRQLERVCSRMILLDHGRVKRDGDPADVSRQFLEESTQSREVTKTASELQPTSGTQEIEFTSVHVNSKSIADGHVSVRTFEPLTVRLRLVARAEVKDVAVVFGLHNPEMIFVTKTSNLLVGEPLHFVPGENLIEFTIPSLQLAPGTYGLGFGITDWAHRSLWSGASLGWIDVQPPPKSAAMLPPSTLCYAAATWRSVRPMVVTGEDEVAAAERLKAKGESAATQQGADA